MIVAVFWATSTRVVWLDQGTLELEVFRSICSNV